jgi:hypothetical protein
MNRNSNAKGKKGGTQVELKYCERCGALGIRESGSGQVYCKNCLPAIGELPVPRNPGGAALAVNPLLEPEDLEFEIYNFDQLNLKQQEAGHEPCHLVDCSSGRQSSGQLPLPVARTKGVLDERNAG